jgi:hypothetical protein
MGRVRVSGFREDCSPPAVEEVGGWQLARRWVGRAARQWRAGGGWGRRGQSCRGKKMSGEEAVGVRKSSGDVEEERRGEEERGIT